MRRCSPPRAQIAAVIVAALRAGNKLLIIGNGGSAADAQHIAAEIIGRYKTGSSRLRRDRADHRHLGVDSDRQ